MKFYFSAMKLHLKSEIEYRLSFIFSFISQIITFFSYYFMIISLFLKFSNIKGFTLYEVLFCFSIIQFGYAFNEVFARGLDKFDDLIVHGGFDRVLLRPKNVIIQVLCNESDFVKTSRLIQAIIILFIALIKLNIKWNLVKIICLILMLLSGIIVFFSIFLLAASYCFITIQGLEVRNVFTDGGKHMAQYPIGIFSKGFIFFFTFVIPYAFVNYYPLLYVIGKRNNILYAFSPLLLFIYVIPCIIVFYLGVKKYESAGS